MKYRYLNLLGSMGFAALVAGPFSASAQESLGAADDFAVLGGSAVTCTRSAVEGNVGVNLGGAVTRTLCPISEGIVSEGDTVAQQAYNDSLLAYDALGHVPCDVDLTGKSLVGLSLTPGVYCFDTAVTQTGGMLTLDGAATDTWIFKVGTSGVGALTGTNFSVVMPGGSPCNNNVFWLTAHAATLTDSVFVGTVLSGRAITVTGGNFDGQALAKTEVTLTDTFVCG